MASAIASTGRPSERHRVQPLIDELRCSSAEFETLWKTHTVASKSHATKLIEHPSVGRLSLDCHSFEVTGVVDQYLLACRAEPGGRSEQALKLLGALSGTERAKGQ